MIECKLCGSAIEPGEQVAAVFQPVTVRPINLPVVWSKVTRPVCIQCAEASARFIIRLEAKAAQ